VTDDVPEAGEQVEVVAASAEHSVELGVVLLAVPPARGHGRDRALGGASARHDPGVIRKRCGPSRTVVMWRWRSAGVDVDGLADVVEHAAQVS
jgi:hypothetical protein